MDKLRERLEGPLDLAQAGQLEAANREFERLLAVEAQKYGRNSLQVADLTSGYGIFLYDSGHEKSSMAYARRAVEAYRRAAGTAHPEVAVALHDLSLILLEIEPETGSPELVTAASEALQIRRSALGPNDAETAVTYILVGRVTGFPNVTRGDPERIEQAASLVRTGLQLLRNAPNADRGDAPNGRFRLAEIYARNGRGDDVMKTVKVAREDFSDEDLTKLADFLGRARDVKGARALRDAYRLDPPAPAGPTAAHVG
jgi:hypothetical protein